MWLAEMTKRDEDDNVTDSASFRINKLSDLNDVEWTGREIDKCGLTWKVGTKGAWQYRAHNQKTR